MTPSLAGFSKITSEWFASTFQKPTPAQSGAWASIRNGENALVVAPTGSGKTLAAFLWAIDRLAQRQQPEPQSRLSIVYVSPLKALAVDIERNLRSPLNGIRAAAQRHGVTLPDISVGIRTGDTPPAERRRFATHPPDILITTPESLFLLLTSRARAALAWVDTVIVDEVHAIASNKRGAHLAVSLERLDHMLAKPAQRVGLSATVRPHDEVARFLGGVHPVEIVAPDSTKEFDLKIVVPVDDMESPGGVDASSDGAEERTSIWPHVERRLLELIRSHRSTIVFANSRRLSERLCARLNDLAEEELVRAHHGSVAREQRLIIEEDLKAGRLPAVVATSSLELGIDMGALDLVVQVEAPDSVASGLQRVGRAGHSVGATSRGIFFPKYRGDLLESAVVAERMIAGEIEHTRYLRNPLDVLAQQIVAMVALEDWTFADLEATIARAAPFQGLTSGALTSVLDMLSGRYPSDEFAELRPRVNWDRAGDVLTARRGAQRLAVTSGGTIPDRGMFGVFMATEDGPRVGELDEEMVYESRPGDTFILGASTWLIEDITHDRVFVSPAPGRPGRTPFWHGDARGRPVELGRALGEFTRTLTGLPDAQARARLTEAGLDERAIANLLAYVSEQKAATGMLPDDRTIVVERFRDELGDWRVCIHSVFGAQVHAPWSQAIESRLTQSLGIDVQCMYTDDGIVIRILDTDETPDLDGVFIDPEEIEEVVIGKVGDSALFASRFRECAARSLLLPKRRPGQRTPLWQQRQKSAQLLQVASKYGSFPVMLEAYRECLQDVFDLPALKALLTDVRSRRVRVVDVETTTPSPFASSLQFSYVAAFMYEGDAPLAERRAQALSLDRSLLAEIMGREELRELLDLAALGELELELQMLTEGRGARDPDEVRDLLRRLGDLDQDEIVARCADRGSAPGWISELVASGAILAVMVAGTPRYIGVEDAARYRDSVGTALPTGVPTAFLDPVGDPVGDVVARFARTHGPFQAGDVAERLGLGLAVVESTLGRLDAAGRVVAGEFRPDGSGTEWIDVGVLRRLRRMSLAAYRKEVEPASPETLARFHLEWQGLGRPARGRPDAAALFAVIEQLQGVPVPASALERQILKARLPGYEPGLLDQLGASGAVVWSGAGAIGSDDGWVCLATSENANALLPTPVDVDLSEEAQAVSERLQGSGAMFFRQIADSFEEADDAEVLLALWELVWAGLVTNDTFAPLRALIQGGRNRPGARPTRPRRGPALPTRFGPPSGQGRWSLIQDFDTQSTRRLHALAVQLLERYGIVTRGSVASERVPGGFAAVYQVLKAMEESGRARRGYFVEGLGGAQFALPGAVDRMRALVDPHTEEGRTQVLAACDPANPYGAALAWPDRDGGHRAGRKAGALVVLVSGRLVLYVEKGGRSLLSYDSDPELLQPAIDALALAARDGALGRVTVQKADGEAVFDTPLAEMLMGAGFRLTSRGLRLRA